MVALFCTWMKGSCCVLTFLICFFCSAVLHLAIWTRSLCFLRIHFERCLY